MSKTTALVGIIMGSQSDWPTMKHAAGEISAQLGYRPAASVAPA